MDYVVFEIDKNLYDRMKRCKYIIGTDGYNITGGGSRMCFSYAICALFEG